MNCSYQERQAMPSLKTIFDAKSVIRFIRKVIQEPLFRLQPNLRGAVLYPPGHYYSPLLDIRSVASKGNIPFDGVEYWEHIGLCPEQQRLYYEDLLERFPPLPFPQHKTDSYRYFTDNTFFGLPDAFTLSGILRKERPRRIIEVGSGFSTAVILDTLTHTRESPTLTLIEPYPKRVNSLLSSEDKSYANILVHRIQEISLSVFDQLDEHDVLFIDSSHVAKIGSDVTFILLRILPRLKPGVLVHFHDIFYPFSYWADWIREGRAWNESLFLRAFLLGNPNFQVVAFNAFAGTTFPELFQKRLPAFAKDPGGSIWLRKVA
jgi:Methyltransferase domain